MRKILLWAAITVASSIFIAWKLLVFFRGGSFDSFFTRRGLPVPDAPTPPVTHTSEEHMKRYERDLEDYLERTEQITHMVEDLKKEELIASWKRAFGVDS